LPILISTITYLIFLAALPIKWDVFAVEAEQDKRDTRATFANQEEELYKTLSLHWIFNLFSIKELYPITCYISLYWVGLISRGADYPSTVEVQRTLGCLEL